MNYLLGGLEQLGYLARRTDPSDTRARIIELTEQGHALRRTLRASVAAIEEGLAFELGEGELAQLKRSLIALNGTTVVRAVRESTGQQIV